MHLHLRESFHGKFASDNTQLENTGILRSHLVDVLDLNQLISDRSVPLFLSNIVPAMDAFDAQVSVAPMPSGERR